MERPSVAGLKQAQRQTARAALAQLSPDARREASAQACAHVDAWPPWQTAQVVMGFVPLLDEPDVLPLLRGVLTRGGVVCLPRVDWAAGTMTVVRVTNLDADVVSDSVMARLGLREPRADLEPVATADISMVLVPGLAFDALGGRLGRGKGYYDKFLAAVPARTVTCGICFYAQLLERVVTEPHDAFVGSIATERGVLPALRS